MYISQLTWMSHPQHIFSLPPSVQVSQEQLQTIDRHVQAVAQTRLAILSEGGVIAGVSLCRGIGIAAGLVMAARSYDFGIAIINGSTAVFFQLLPTFLIGSLVVTICLLGRHALRLEQKERFKRECLEFEHQLIEHKYPCLAFKNALENFQCNRSLENLIALEQEGEALAGKLAEMDTRLAHMSERLETLHRTLFGSTRTFNNGSTWTDYWTRCFRDALASHLSCARSSIGEVPAALQNVRRHGSLQDVLLDSTALLTERQRENVVHFNEALERAHNKFFPDSRDSASPDEWLERARASLAAFRSTLDQ